jgi:hypothetical protein
MMQVILHTCKLLICYYIYICYSAPHVWLQPQNAQCPTVLNIPCMNLVPLKYWDNESNKIKPMSQACITTYKDVMCHIANSMLLQCKFFAVQLLYASSSILILPYLV